MSEMASRKRHCLLWIIEVLAIVSAVQQNSEALHRHEMASGSMTSSSSDLFPPHGKCEPITISICMDLPYNATIMPNMLGHTRQEEAGLEVYQFAPLVKIDCSPDLQFFLCLVYVPLCTILDHPIPPCRSLCESARVCENVMRTFDFDWPENLDCAKFPEAGGEEICVAQNTSNSSPPSNGFHTPKVVNPRKNIAGAGSTGMAGGNGAGGPHRNIRFVCPVQLKTPQGLGYALQVGGEVSSYFYFRSGPGHLRALVSTKTFMGLEKTQWNIVLKMLQTMASQLNYRIIIFLEVITGEIAHSSVLTSKDISDSQSQSYFRYLRSYTLSNDISDLNKTNSLRVSSGVYCHGSYTQYIRWQSHSIDGTIIHAEIKL